MFMDPSDSSYFYSEDFTKPAPVDQFVKWLFPGTKASGYSSDDTSISFKYPDSVPLNCYTYYCEKCGSDEMKMIRKCGNKISYLWHMKQEHPETFLLIQEEEENASTIVSSEAYYMSHMKRKIVPLEDDAKGLKRLQDARLAQNLPPTNIVLPPLKKQKYECSECGFVNFHRGGFARHKCEKWKALTVKENLRRQKATAYNVVNPVQHVEIIK